MPNIKPVSDLRSYNEVLKDIDVGEPVFLTKNGRGKYVILDIKEYQKSQATIKLLSKLMEAEKAIKTGEEWLTEDQVRQDLGVWFMHKLRINPIARRDLLEIRDYIANDLDSPDAAINVVLKIIESYEKLKEFPFLGIELSSKIHIETDYQYLISGKYLVFYKVDDVYVTIYRILYARRDYTRILFEEA